MCTFIYKENLCNKDFRTFLFWYLGVEASTPSVQLPFGFLLVKLVDIEQGASSVIAEIPLKGEAMFVLRSLQ